MTGRPAATSVATCSREQNPELFRHAMGGYGLFGAITELELDMVPIRWAVHIANPWFIQDISGIATDQNNAAGNALLDHLTWWSGALKTART